MRNIKILYFLVFLFPCCSNNEKDLTYFKLVKFDTVKFFDTIKFLETQIPEYEISIGPDSTNVYLTEYKFGQKDDSTFELIPEMTRNLKSKKVIMLINHLLKDVDTTYDFTAIGAYGISAINKRYYVGESAQIDSICKELILQIKGNKSQKVDYYEYRRKYQIPLPPLQGRIYTN